MLSFMAIAGVAAAAGEKVSSSDINAIVIAIALALALGFIKVVEAAVVWIMNRNKKDEDSKEKDNVYFNGYHPVAHLDHEMVKLLKDFHGDATENLREIATCLKDVSRTQGKLIDRMEKFEEKARESHEEVLEELSAMRRSN